MAKKNEETKRERRPFMERTAERLLKTLDTLDYCKRHEKMAKQAEGLMNQIQEFAKVCAEVPSDWSPISETTPAQSWEKGDKAAVRVEYAGLHMVGEDAVGKVEEIVRHGEGRGSKVFLRVDFGNKVGKRVGPASHFVPA